jgi:hypothetical protein
MLPIVPSAEQRAGHEGTASATCRQRRVARQTVDDALLQYLLPLGGQHINFPAITSGGSPKISARMFRPLRPLQPAYHALFSVF